MTFVPRCSTKLSVTSTAWTDTVHKDRKSLSTGFQLGSTLNLWRPERSTADVDPAAAESSPDKIVNVNVGRHQFNVLPSWKPVGSGDSQIKGNTKTRKKKIPKRFFLWHACFQGDKLLFGSWKVVHLCEALGMVVPGFIGCRVCVAFVLSAKFASGLHGSRPGSITKVCRMALPTSLDKSPHIMPWYAMYVLKKNKSRPGKTLHTLKSFLSTSAKRRRMSSLAFPVKSENQIKFGLVKSDFPTSLPLLSAIICADTY